MKRVSERFNEWMTLHFPKASARVKALWTYLTGLSEAYRLTFDPSKEHVRIVLADLQKECFGEEALPTDDPIKMAEAVGANRILKRIRHFSNIDHGTMFEIYKERLRE